MSALSRGRNPNVPKSENQASKQKDTIVNSDSDDDLIITSSKTKFRPRIDNPTGEIEQDLVPKRGQKKPVKVKLPKNLPKKEAESQKKQENKPEPGITEKIATTANENDNNDDTLLALERQIGRRFDENSEPDPIQRCVDIIAESEQSEPEHENKPSGQIVCPFCWKKLHDKLNGMTHVKACGKNLPIERIFEALQLHERQIKEWEQIGISYPGFQGGNTKSKLPANANGEGAGVGKPKRGGGKGRRKKQNLVDDPDLDLAMALSASLHEEVVERQRAEINHLAEAGLHNEAVEKAKATTSTSKDPGGEQQEPERPALMDAVSEFRLRFSKETKKLQKAQPGKREPQPSVKARGGRGNTKDLVNTKLFTLTQAEKAAIVAQRVAQIMESSERKANGINKEPYKLTEANLNAIGCGQRLKEFCDEESKLWKMSSDMNEVPNEDFYTASVKECKKQVQAIEDKNKERSRGKTSKPNEMPVPGAATSDREKRNYRKSIVNRTGPINVNGKNSESSATSREITTNHKETGSSIGRLGQDLLKLFTQKTGTDLTVYGREEKPIRAHKLIVQARCAKLLQEIVVEEGPNGRKSEIIPLTCFSHLAVKSFIWQLYSGQPFPFTSDNSELMARYLEEMEEIAQKYNFRLDEESHRSSSSPSPEQQSIRCSVDVEKMDQEIQTDEIVEVKPSAKCSVCNNVQTNDHDRDLDQGSNESSLNSSTNEVTVPNIRRLSTESTGSVDLFEGYGDSDEDEMKKITESRISDESLEKAKKKRSRSLSPQLEDVIILDDDSPLSQANKKYKLDSPNNLSPIPIPVHIDNPDSEVSLLSLCESDKQSLADEVLNELLTPHASKTVTGDKFRPRSGDCVQMTSPVTRHSERLSQARRSLRLEVNLAASPSNDFDPLPVSHSPNNDFLFLNDDNHFPCPQEHEEFDNCDNWDYEDNDDSVFARIPEEILQRTSPPIPNPSRSRSSPHLSPIPVHASVPYVSSLTFNEKDNDNVVKTNSKNAKGNRKGQVKGGNRKNMSSSQPLQQRNRFEENLARFTSTNSSTTTTPINAQTQGLSRREIANQTPMLNYSTIDTPILKKELKKYGLKPLPRTKAKLLLRHIYKETHKPADDDD